MTYLDEQYQVWVRNGWKKTKILKSKDSSTDDASRDVSRTLHDVARGPAASYLVLD